MYLISPNRKLCTEMGEQVHVLHRQCFWVGHLNLPRCLWSILRCVGCYVADIWIRYVFLLNVIDYKDTILYILALFTCDMTECYMYNFCLMKQQQTQELARYQDSQPHLTTSNQHLLHSYWKESNMYILSKKAFETLSRQPVYEKNVMCRQGTILIRIHV